MPLEVAGALLEFLLGEEQTIILSIDRQAVASSADRRAQIADQHRALADWRFEKLLEETDDLIAFLLGDEQTTALGFERRLAASSADWRAQAAAQRRALGVLRFDVLQLARDNAIALWEVLESHHSR